MTIVLNFAAPPARNLIAPPSGQGQRFHEEGRQGFRSNPAFVPGSEQQVPHYASARRKPAAESHGGRSGRDDKVKLEKQPSHPVRKGGG
jgi:hypothetical protein